MKIMHMSDLHLGSDIILRSIYRRRSWVAPDIGSVTAGLSAAVRNLKPDYLVISGDFVNKPTPKTFNVAASYVRDLLSGAGFDYRTRLLVVPGNHDVSFLPRKQEDDFARLRLYRNFLRVLFGESDVDARKTRYFLLNADHRALFACLDSTLRSSAPLAEGEIGVSQRRWLSDKMSNTALANHVIKRYAKIAVLHHHCVPIAGTPASSERFMQLLDAGDVLETFDRLGFNIVLHGHKHYPHVTTRQRSDSSILVVIGAGTTTCPYLEEQQQCGNNFNLITVSPDANQLAIQLYKADGNGQFIPQGELRQFPLFRIEPLGYSTRRIKKTIEIERDGTKSITLTREGIRIEQPGKVMNNIPFQISSDTLDGKIEDFRFDDTHVTANTMPHGGTILRGTFDFRQQLSYGSPSIDISYSYKIKKGAAMSRVDLPKCYADGRDTESTTVILTNHVETLEIELNFPHGYPAKPQVRIEHLGAAVQCGHEFKVDKPLNRWELIIADPPLDHRVHVEWRVPENWP